MSQYTPVSRGIDWSAWRCPEHTRTHIAFIAGGFACSSVFQKSLAHGKYYAGLESLSWLQGMPPQSSWTSAHVDKWVHDAKGFWEHCKAQVDTAEILAKDFQGVEYEFLQLLLEFPDEKVVSSCLEYNELVNRAQQYSLKVFPLPLPENLVPVPPSRSPFLLLRKPSYNPAAGPQPPKLTLLGPHLPVATPEPSFSLDPTSPLHLAANITISPPSFSPFTDSIVTCRSNPLRVITPSVPVLPDPVPASAGSISSSYWNCTPLFFPGTDDEDEPPTLGAIDKGKGKEIISGTDKDKYEVSGPTSELMAMDIGNEDDGSPPPTNIAWRYHSLIFAGPNPTSVSEVRIGRDIHLADPNSTLFKLLGAPEPKKSKKSPQKKSKFDNPPPVLNNSAAEGTTSKAKEVVMAPKGGINRPRGPSRIRPPLASMGVQGGGFGEEVPAGLQPIVGGFKTIGVLVVSKDFRDFVEVDKALWNKKVAPFVGEQCILVFFESLDAFESSMDTLTQHANALEDIITNYLAGIDTMTHLQGVRAQIGHLHESLNSNTQVEEVPDDDDAGFGVGEVAEGEPGPSRKQKRSRK
ncbi:hypothetical protein IW261DRAFT_1420614 [Armillaria novae-zelandiae]|uniref:Uncharacterized protein n=1 Tax=Armillaria novae-zelandiae TaxID=153914 RepID=A0AA39P6N4_9AGAR|nr:hypothetical protein IW261DRAFT_1420614 [Armillaria novae-zelandiae]